MPATASMSATGADARAFAESVAGVLARHGPEATELPALLDGLGWDTLAQDQALAACAGLGAVELGRRLAPLHHVDRLLGAAPAAGGLVRSLGPEGIALTGTALRIVRRSEAVAYAEGLEVHRVLELGEPVGEVPATALATWRAACVGYLGGLGQGAVDLTIEYARGRRAFGTTLGALASVQQLLASAATAIGGVRLLAGEAPDTDALAHAGHAIAGACAACHQVSGAIGFTLEYPLHRYTQCARALATWNDALLQTGAERLAQ